MKVTDRPLSSIKPYDKNPRRNDTAAEKVAESIRRFGFNVPITVDADGVIVTGHTRYKAAKILGLKSVPCVVLDLPPDEIRAFRLADNRVSEFAQWDGGLLRAEVEALQASGIDLASVGLSDAELTEIIGGLTPEIAGAMTDAEIDDAVPDIPEEPPVSRRGEVYVLGRHRLMCGDSTSKEDVERLMAGRKADLLLTDPPYNVDYTGGTDKRLKIKNDAMSPEQFDSFLHAAFARAHESMRKGAPFYVFHASISQRTFENALEHNLLPVREQIIWVKDNLVLGRQDYQWRHEPVFYGWKEGATRTWNSDRKQTTVADIAPERMFVGPDGTAVLTVGGRTWRFPLDTALEEVEGTVVRAPKPKRSAQHPTMKPVALLKYFIRNSSNENALVLDLFGGSGSTMAACHVTGRDSASMELDPRYCDVIRQRYAGLVGAADWREATPAEVRDGQ